MPEICKDCDQPIPQPASTSAMAHDTNLNASESLAAPSPSPASAPSDEKVEEKKEEEGFVPPVMRDVKPSVVIEFCDRCRWAPRASWIQTELFLTFPNPLLKSITLMPLNAPETGGRFRVWVDIGEGDRLAWDRKTEGGFPELKILKQRIRNIIQPNLDLGHSDVHGKQEK